MNHERFRKICDILEAAWELPPTERDAYLVAACNGDSELLEEVRSLAKHEPDRTRFLEPPEIGSNQPSQVSSPRPKLEDFELREIIGRGGFGVVYRARQVSLDRDVAVKVLPDLLAPTPSMRDRFVREAQAIAKLRHPGIVSIHAVGHTDGLHWFAMDLVDGHDLHAELAIHRGLKQIDRIEPVISSGGHAPILAGPTTEGWPATCARIVADIADALHHAHVNGVVHRDVKPRNLLIDRNERVRIVDFGLAKDERFGSITKSNEIAGTPHYMSPEQVEAKRTDVDHRTDIYSLGVVLYELLTLERPFEGRSHREILDRIQIAASVPPRKINPRVPRDLDAICQRAMAHDAKRRYSTALRFGHDLRRFLAHEAVEAQPPTILDRVLAWTTRHRVAIGVISLMLVVATIADRIRSLKDLRARIDATFSSLVDQSKSIGESTSNSAELREWRDTIETLLAAEDLLSSAQKSFVAAEHSRAQEHARRLLASLPNLLSEPAPQPTDDSRWDRMFDAILAADQGLALRPDSIEFAHFKSPEGYYPRLSVGPGREFNQEGRTGRVFRRMIDPATAVAGSLEFLGAFPLVDAPVRPGYQRIIVEFDPSHFGEYTRDLRWGRESHTIEIGRVRSRTDLLHDVVEIPSAEVLKPAEMLIPFPSDGIRQRIDAFLMSTREVTVREFLNFLRTTNRPWPPLLESWSRIDSFLDCPAVGIPWSDALAYAEWANMRLPTALEWAYAARGVEWRRYPWTQNITDPRSVALVGAVANDSIAGTANPAGLLSEYMSTIRPVGSFPGGASPHGALDLYGSVWEFTESIVLEPVANSLRWDRDHRYAMGCSFRSDPAHTDLRIYMKNGILPTAAAADVGFRCVKSLNP